jgi:DNA-binding ferritin-like protein
MREQIDNLIVNLMVIQNFSKDIHYTCHGDAFYSKHLLVDKFNFDEAIDLLKECCLLGNGDRPKSSKEYMKQASEYLIIAHEDDDKENFKTLSALLFKTLGLIDNMQDLSKADENVIGGIAQDLQQYKGLINLQVE